MRYVAIPDNLPDIDTVSELSPIKQKYIFCVIFFASYFFLILISLAHQQQKCRLAHQIVCYIMFFIDSLTA